MEGQDEGQISGVTNNGFPTPDEESTTANTGPTGSPARKASSSDSGDQQIAAKAAAALTVEDVELDLGSGNVKIEAPVSDAGAASEQLIIAVPPRTSSASKPSERKRKKQKRETTSTQLTK